MEFYIGNFGSGNNQCVSYETFSFLELLPQFSVMVVETTIHIPIFCLPKVITEQQCFLCISLIISEINLMLILYLPVGKIIF
jgi:hypothetical protein